jgi:NADPH:quinone reductase-like Zn-dependent oxidoreductase
MHCEYCLSERDNQCASYDILGYRANGGYAEYVKAPSVNVLSKPKNLSFEEASSIPLVFLTAWHMLVDRVNLRPGETLLVHAAGSGVGSAAIQIGKLLGARVIATAGANAKIDKAKSLGADDLDGTINEGGSLMESYLAEGNENQLTKAGIEEMVRGAGRIPIERDTLYNAMPVNTSPRTVVGSGLPILS